MQRDPANFSHNLELLMYQFKLTQAELAGTFELPKTTVNKWFITNAVPSNDNLTLICSHINSKIFNDKKITIDLLLANPYDFANAIEMPWYKVGSIVTKARLPVRNLVFEPGDPELNTITGFYNIFYPSVAFKGAFFAAALKIMVDGGFFYFEAFNHESSKDQIKQKGWKLQSLYQSGSVARFGEAETSNAILIGDLVGAEHGERVRPSLQFTSFKIPRESRPSKLFGRAIALDFNERSASYGFLLATPAVALAQDNVPRDCSVKERAPKEPYFDLNEMRDKFPNAISALEQTPVPWCHPPVCFDRSDEGL